MLCMWPASGAAQIRGVLEVEGHGLAVGRDAGLHARLISDAAVVGHEQLVGAVEVKHRDHVFRTHAHDFAHDGGAAGNYFEGDLQNLAVGGFLFPCAGHVLDGGEGFLGVGLGVSHGGEEEQWEQGAECGRHRFEGH